MREKRGTVRTGTAALGSALMALALAVSPVGATPFTGHVTGGGYIEVSEDYASMSGVASSYDTLVGELQCRFDVTTTRDLQLSGCDGVGFSGFDDPGYLECWTKDGDEYDAYIVTSTSCTPYSCFDANGAIVAGCTAQMSMELQAENEFSTGIFAGVQGTHTVTGSLTYKTSEDGYLTVSFSGDTTGDITLAGSAPPDGVSLDIPAPDSTQSGIGVVSGWSCLGGKLEVTFSEADGTHILTWPIPHGAERKDTQGTCGDIYNGISLPINWYHLGPGAKTLALFVNGEKRLTRNFSVTTFGQEFVTDAGGMCTIADFRDGQNATFVWQQANQGLVLEALN